MIWNYPAANELPRLNTGGVDPPRPAARGSKKPLPSLTGGGFLLASWQQKPDEGIGDRVESTLRKALERATTPEPENGSRPRRSRSAIFLPLVGR
jgi:hypothetical protein